MYLFDFRRQHYNKRQFKICGISASRGFNCLLWGSILIVFSDKLISYFTDNLLY